LTTNGHTNGHSASSYHRASEGNRTPDPLITNPLARVLAYVRSLCGLTPISRVESPVQPRTGTTTDTRVRLTQHIPNFVDYRDTVPFAIVGGAAEVRAVSWVAYWLKAGGLKLCVDDGRYLMVDGRRDGKRWWWVVGIFDTDVDWFPKWHPPA
jgi:hypothetical protein